MKRQHSSRFILPFSLSLLLFAGCRQQDYRETTFALPGLAPLSGQPALLQEAERQIAEAFASYEQHRDPNTGTVTQTNPLTGIDLDSLKLTDKTGTVTLTVKFDSLQVAEMNIIRLLDTTVITNLVLTEGRPTTNLMTGVVYPGLKENAPAGFINARKEEVEK